MKLPEGKISTAFEEKGNSTERIIFTKLNDDLKI